MIKVKKWKKKILIFLSILTFIIIGLVVVFNQFLYGLLFFYGYREVYNGNDDKGNKIMRYSISKLENLDPKIYHALSVQNTKNGNYDIAIPALEKSYEIIPEEAGAYYGWVLLYYYHDYEKSLKILNKYDETTPNFIDAPMGENIHYLKGLAYAQLKDYDNAIKEYNMVIDEEKDVYYLVLLNKGISLYYSKKYTEAILLFDKTLISYDKCSEAYYFKGLSQLKLNDINSACTNFNKSINLIKQGYKSSDTYVELFHEIYEKEVENSILKFCKD